MDSSSSNLAMDIKLPLIQELIPLGVVHGYYPYFMIDNYEWF